MGKAGLAAKIADEVGTTVDDAYKWVDDVGVPKAQSALDDITTRGSKTVEKWWKPATAGGAVVGGTAVAWRQQDVWEAQAIADQQQTYADAFQSIMESDLDPAQKEELVDELRNSSPASGQNSGGGGGGILGNDLQTTLVLIVIVAIVLSQTLDTGGDS